MKLDFSALKKPEPTQNKTPAKNRGSAGLNWLAPNHGALTEPNLSQALVSAGLRNERLRPTETKQAKASVSVKPNNHGLSQLRPSEPSQNTKSANTLERAPCAALVLQLEGGCVVLEGEPEKVAQWAEALRPHRAELLKLLQSAANAAAYACWVCDQCQGLHPLTEPVCPCGHWLDTVAERAGILEFEAGFSREEAEALALEPYRKKQARQLH